MTSSGGPAGGPGRPLRIRTKIAADLLPSEPPESTRAGFGQGEPCNACDAIIHPVQLEYELEYADRRTLRMHQGCHRIWQAQLRRRTPPR
jgi:hypothetical protein